MTAFSWWLSLIAWCGWYVSCRYSCSGDNVHWLHVWLCHFSGSVSEFPINGESLFMIKYLFASMWDDHPTNSNKITLASEYSWCKVWEPGCAMHSVCRPLKSCFLMCVIIGTVRGKVNFRNCIVNVKAEVMCLELNSHISCKHLVFYRAVLVDAACSWWSVGSYCRHVCWDNTLHCASFTRGEEHEGEVANKRETKAIAQYSIRGHGDTSGKARHRGFRSPTAPQPYWSSWIGWEFKSLVFKCQVQKHVKWFFYN